MTKQEVIDHVINCLAPLPEQDYHSVVFGVVGGKDTAQFIGGNGHVMLGLTCTLQHEILKTTDEMEYNPNAKPN